MTAACRWLVMLLMALALPAGAEIYSYIDADGNRVFTDRPAGQAAERIELRPANGMPAPPTPTTIPAAAKAEAPAAHYRLQILAPAADETIRNNAGDLTVVGNGSPLLLPGHAYQLLLDGEPLGEAGPDRQFVLRNIDRGTHQLHLLVVDARGSELARSPTQTFHLIRTSLAQRRMVKPCQKADYGVRPECPLKDKPAEKRDIPFVPFL